MRYEIFHVDGYSPGSPDKKYLVSFLMILNWFIMHVVRFNLDFVSYNSYLGS